MQPADIPGFDLPGGDCGCLLLHGFSGTPHEMRFLGERLQERGLSVSAIRLPGHATLGPELLRSGRREWIQAARQGLEMLLARCPTVFVAGLSMGSLLTIELACEYGERIRAIVLMAPPLFLADGRLRRYAPLLRAALPVLPVKWRLRPKRDSDVADPEARRNQPLFPMPVRGMVELAALQLSARRMLPRVRQPALILHGRLDHTCPLENAEIARREIGSSRVRCHILEHSAHVITVDRDREEVAAEVGRFIEENRAVAVG